MNLHRRLIWILFVLSLLFLGSSAHAESSLPPCPGEYNETTWTDCVGEIILPEGATPVNTGDHYEGEWKNGKPDGKGVLTGKKNGDFRYVGEFKNGGGHGQGTFTHADGDKYVGEFKDDNFNGQGTFTFANGRKYVGDWKDGEQNGQGTLTAANGFKYVGDWKDGEQNGQGTLTDANGNNYVGGWKDGKYHGQGTFTMPDGTEYVGEWKRGLRHGWGTEIYRHRNNKYVGEWKHGMPHGKGTVTYSDGSEQAGVWEKGDFVKPRSQRASSAGSPPRSQRASRKYRHVDGSLNEKALVCPMRCEPVTSTVTLPYGEVVKLTCLQSSDTKVTKVYIAFEQPNVALSWIDRGGKDKLSSKVIPPERKSKSFSRYKADLDTIKMSRGDTYWTINRKSLKAKLTSIPLYEMSGTCEVIEASKVGGELARELNPLIERWRKGVQERNERAVRDNKI